MAFLLMLNTLLVEPTTSSVCMMVMNLSMLLFSIPASFHNYSVAILILGVNLKGHLKISLPTET